MSVKDKGKKAVEKRNVALEQLKVEYVNRDKLSPNTYNPNRQSEHDFELLCRSMREDGFTQPIIVHKDTMQIVDGEHRWRASAVVFGEHCEVPVCFVEMTVEQMKIATLRHNRARGSEDVELSAQVLRDLQALGALDWAADSLMLDDLEMNRLLTDIPLPEQLAGEEFTGAWEPQARDENEQVAPSVQANTQVTDKGTVTTAMTQQAADAVRAQEQRIASAKTEEERQMARQDTSIYRVSLIFQGSEADEVKAALGLRPAERLLELCRAELEREKGRVEAQRAQASEAL